MSLSILFYKKRKSGPGSPRWLGFTEDGTSKGLSLGSPTIQKELSALPPPKKKKQTPRKMWEEAIRDGEGPPHSSELGNPSPGRTTNPGVPSMLLADTPQLPSSSVHIGSLHHCLAEKGHHAWLGLTVSLA